jgi:hypothetical protein
MAILDLILGCMTFDPFSYLPMFSSLKCHSNYKVLYTIYTFFPFYDNLFMAYDKPTYDMKQHNYNL